MTEEIKTKGVDEKFCESCGGIIKIAAEICPRGIGKRLIDFGGESEILY